MLARVSAFAAVVTAGLCCLPGAVRAQGEPTKNEARILAAFRPIQAQVSKSVARVLSDGSAVGLGTVVGADGWILTKHSLLGDTVTVQVDGKTLPAKVVGVKDEFDLALLKVEAKGLSAVRWQPSKGATPGDWVFAASDGKTPLAVGVVSVATRTVSRREYPPQTNPNSGFLGINLTDNPDGGAKIGRVEKDSAAEKAGLEAGDVILAIDDKPIADAESLMSTLSRTRPKDVVSIRYKREGKEDTVKATLGTRPGNIGSRSDFQNRQGSDLSEMRTGFPAILQHDTVVKPAECGGPLVDLEGKVLGINIARAGRVETYAVPSENILALLDELKSGKLAPTDVKRQRLERAVKEAEEALALEQKKVAATRELVAKAAKAAEDDGKDNPDLVKALDKARKLATAAERAVAEAKDTLSKAKAALDKHGK